MRRSTTPSRVWRRAPLLERGVAVVHEHVEPGTALEPVVDVEAAGLPFAVRPAAHAEAEGEVLLDPVGVPLEAVLGEVAVLLVDRQVDDGFGEVGARWAVVAGQDVREAPRRESPGVGVVERQFVAEAVEQEVVDDVDVLVDALGRLHPVVAAGGTGVHPHDGVLGHVDQCPVEEDLGVGLHDRVAVEVAKQPVVLDVRAGVLRRVLLLAVDVAAEVVGGVAGGPGSGVAEEGVAEVVPVVVGLGRVVLDRSTVERLVGVHLGQQHGRGEDLQLVVLGAVVVVRRARDPWVGVLDVEADAVRGRRARRCDPCRR